MLMQSSLHFYPLAPKNNICGNEVVEDGEECDCGWDNECEDRCCNPMTETPGIQTPCTLKKNITGNADAVCRCAFVIRCNYGRNNNKYLLFAPSISRKIEVQHCHDADFASSSACTCQPSNLIVYCVPSFLCTPQHKVQND